MKTSLGIWALGTMATRFVPGGYKPEFAGETTAERVRRAVEGLGDLIDGYEFHYPQELSAENLDEVRDALGEHDIYCMATGLHLDPRFGRGGLVSPDPAIRAEAVARTLDAAEFAGSLGAHFIIWPGIEGYNYPFQTPYADSWAWLVDGIGQAAEVCARHGVKLFLEHKNSEPAMKILMRNVGMTLHVIHKLRAQGIDNVQVNMDWQHLIMNRENLAEYAALLAAEGLLGHQHANSGWGDFDDDNIVGATAFMETLELAVELRRANYGEGGERLGFDLYPYTEDAVAAVRRSVLQWRFIDGGRREDRRRGAARGAGGRRTPCARTSSSTPPSAREARRARRRDDRRQGARALADGGGARARRARVSALDAAARLGRAGSRRLVAGERGGARASSAGRRASRSGSPVRCTGSSRSARTTPCCGRRSSGTTSAPRAECAEIERARRPRAADRSSPGIAPSRASRRRSSSGCGGTSRRSSPGSRTCCSRRTTCASGSRGERAIDAADASGTLLFDVAGRRWSDEMLAAARASRGTGCRRRTRRPRSPARATRPPRRSGSA